ncbi:MAG: GNAT family N-acetyltransferase [Halanaerobiales bacterium]|nr:GNAT family N-acetyltransferase [Halanaerobiales bacterium]
MIKIKIRKCNYREDLEKIFEIWHEIGWIEDDKKEEDALKEFINSGRGKVALLNDEVEGYLNSVPGKFQYLNRELELQVIAAVTISRIARKQNIATHITAEAIAEAAAEGVHISALSMFEQGFYNKLGYGNGSYQNFISFDPAHLNIKKSIPIPERITLDDFKDVHKARIQRKKQHGYCTLLPSEITYTDMAMRSKKSFGLGFRNKKGNITHHMWIKPEDNLHGPYYIRWMVFNNSEQFLDLMQLLKNMGDQIHLVKMNEPGGIQLQNLIKKPHKDKTLTKKGKYQVINKVSAYWQIRILNLQDCIKNTSLRGTDLRFNLELDDPIEKYLNNKSLWSGLSGNYILSLGKESSIKKGKSSDLLTLKTDINAFTRMWLGTVRPVFLPYTDYFIAPKPLLEKLDNLFITLPQPNINWDF